MQSFDGEKKKERRGSVNFLKVKTFLYVLIQDLFILLTYKTFQQGTKRFYYFSKVTTVILAFFFSVKLRINQPKCCQNTLTTLLPVGSRQPRHLHVARVRLLASSWRV